MAAPVPLPDAIKALRGRPGHHPIHPAVEMPLVIEIPKAPEWLGEVGQAEWYRIAEILRQVGLLSGADFEALAGYCHAVEVRRELVAALRKAIDDGDLIIEEQKGDGGGTRLLAHPLLVQEREASRQVLRHAIEFGFTPAARARVRPDAIGQKTKFGELVEQTSDSKRRGKEAREASN